MSKELLNVSIQLHSGGTKGGEFIKQNRIQRRSVVSVSLESRHPDPIAQHEVVQEAMDTAKRALALFPILGILQLCAILKKPFVGDPLVASQHLKMAQEVHVSELTAS